MLKRWKHYPSIVSQNTDFSSSLIKNGSMRNDCPKVIMYLPNDSGRQRQQDTGLVQIL